MSFVQLAIDVGFTWLRIIKYGNADVHVDLQIEK